MIEQRYFPSLTGIRAVAAFMVYIFHFNPFTPEKFGNEVFGFFDQFNAGVSVFFVLSGFLISARYQDSIQFNFEWFKQYILKRFARIYPIYFILTTITFLILWLDIFPVLPQTSPKEFNSFTQYLLNITFLKGFFDVFKNTGLPQSWSLTVEECFYLCAPLLFLLKTRVNLFIQCLIILISGITLTYIFCEVNFFGFFASLKFTLSVTFFGRIIEFYIGMKLFDLYKNRGVEGNNNGLPLFTFAGILGGSLTICLLVFLSKEGSFYLIKILVFNWMLPVFIAITFWGLLIENSFLRKILETDLFQLLGKSSYAFYLLHMGCLQIFFYTYFNTNYTLIFLSLILSSIVLYKLVEEPLQKIIMRQGTDIREKNIESVPG